MDTVQHEGFGKKPFAPWKFAVVAAMLASVLFLSSATLAYYNHQSDLLGDSVVSISSSCSANAIPDTGTTCKLTAILSANCAPPRLCPMFMEVIPSPPYIVNWSFGDGTTASGNPVSHNFPGFVVWSQCYTARVTVTDTSGNTATASVDALTGTPAGC